MERYAVDGRKAASRASTSDDEEESKLLPLPDIASSAQRRQRSPARGNRLAPLAGAAPTRRRRAQPAGSDPPRRASGETLASIVIQRCWRGLVDRTFVRMMRRPLPLYAMTSRAGVRISERVAVEGMPGSVARLMKVAARALRVGQTDFAVLHSRCLSVDFLLRTEQDLCRLWREVLASADGVVGVELVVLPPAEYRALCPAPSARQPGVVANPLRGSTRFDHAVVLQAFEQGLFERKIDTRKWTGLGGVQTAEDLWMEERSRLCALSFSSSAEVLRKLRLVRVVVFDDAGNALLRSPYDRRSKRRSSFGNRPPAPDTLSGRWSEPPLTVGDLADVFHVDDNVPRTWLSSDESPFLAAVQCIKRALFPKDKRTTLAFLADCVVPRQFHVPLQLRSATPQYPGLTTEYTVYTLELHVRGLAEQPFRTTDQSTLHNSVADYDCVQEIIQWRWAPMAELYQIKGPPAEQELATGAGSRAAAAAARGLSVVAGLKWLRSLGANRVDPLNRAAARSMADAQLPPAPLTEASIAAWMKRNGIDRRKYGLGSAKSIGEFVAEVEDGVCRISLSETAPGEYVPLRQLLVSKLFIAHQHHEQKRLVETHRIIDGERISLTYRHPSVKVAPGATAWAAAVQCVRDELTQPLAAGHLVASTKLRRPTVRLTGKAMDALVKGPSPTATPTPTSTPPQPSAISLRDVAVPVVETVESRSYPDLLSQYVLRGFDMAVEGLPETAFQTKRGNIISFWDWLSDAERERASQLPYRIQFFLRITDDKGQDRHRVQTINQFFLEAAQSNDVEALRLLLELWEVGSLAKSFKINLSGFDPFAVTDKHGNTALRLAALSGTRCRETAGLLLRRSLARYEHMSLRTDLKGCTLLYYAALIEDLPLLDALLRLNADPSSACLLCSASHGCSNSVRILLQRLRHSPSQELLKTPSLPCVAGQHPKPSRTGRYYRALLEHVFSSQPPVPNRLASMGYVLQQTDPTSPSPYLPEYLLLRLQDETVECGHDYLLQFVQGAVYPVHMLVAVVHALKRAAKTKPSHSVILLAHAQGMTSVLLALLDSCNDRDTALGIMQECSSRSLTSSPFHLVAEYGIREVVAHPVYQAEHLKVWYGSAAPLLESRSVTGRLAVCFGLFLLQLLIFPVVVLLPLLPGLRTALCLHRSEFSGPYYKFFASSLLYLCWTVVLIVVALEGHGSLSFSGWEVALFTMMAGFDVGLLEQLYVLGPGKFWKIASNRADVVLLLSFLLALVIKLQGHLELYQDAMALTAIIMILRIILLFACHPTVGPLAIALVSMSEDFIHFSSLLLVSVVAFGIGVTFLSGRNEVPELFSREPVEALMWSFFSPFVMHQPEQSHQMFDVIFFVFLICVGVIMNRLLIAMLCNSYAAVQTEAENQWKFTMALLADHHASNPLIPPPLNLPVVATSVIGYQLGLCPVLLGVFAASPYRDQERLSLNLDYRQMRIDACRRFFGSLN